MSTAEESPFRFPKTSWRKLRADSDTTAPLEHVARAYQRPLLSWIRVALPVDHNGAEDLLQDFLAWVAEHHVLLRADPDRGRFRGFLKTALRRFAGDAIRRDRALRRGGDRPLLEVGPDLDVADPGPAPDECLDAAWRDEVVQTAVHRVREELEAAGRGFVFEIFQAYFLDPAEDVNYQELAARWSVSVGDVSNHLMRAKRLFRRHLEGIVAETCEPSERDAELRWLLTAG